MNTPPNDTPIALNHATVLDVVAGKMVSDQRVRIVGGVIESVAPAGRGSPAGGGATAADEVIDVAGKTVMPGLCDAHVHVTAWTEDLGRLQRTPASYTTARAAEILRGMLHRGFTTVRDAGGADYGLAAAVEEGRLEGPRILFCGQALSQTGGHGDLRGAGEPAGGWIAPGLGRVCDGVTEVRRACREEIRRGARHIKLMLSGGVTSPTDRIDSSQFSEEEIRAAVEEARLAGLYCMAHAYAAPSVNRALACGVRSIEHGNLIDASSVDLFRRHDAFLVPTLTTYEVLALEGQSGLSAENLAKLAIVRDKGLAALETAARAGLKIAYGTDLLGPMHKHQLLEFSLRAKVQKPIDVIRSATVSPAELFQEAGRLGVIAPGARADLLVVDGDPLKDLSCLQEPQRRLVAIMKGGVFFRRP